MKILVLLTITVCAVTASLTQEEVAQKWDTFKTTHNKVYKNHQEELFRKQIFVKNLQRIEEHNARYYQGLETFRMSINKFVDFTEEELRALRPYIDMSEIEHNASSDLSEVSEIPSSLDWRDNGVVTPVKNQGSCGSCWAFATTGALEAHLGIHGRTKVTLSEQQLVDCSEESNGCNGGWAYKSYKYIIENGGINYDTDYPYEARDDTCRYDQNKPKVTIRDYSYHTRMSETDLKNLVATEGPVATSIHASDDFNYYQDGVYYNPDCPEFSSNHVVVIVGYGNENGQDYWLVKNSWGADWGLEGYIKMSRNRNNNCGIASYIAYPLL